jgi:proline dehydrogenase
MYIPVYSKFIGGLNINHAIQLVQQNAAKWQPIFDLAQEGCKTEKQVLEYTTQVSRDIDAIKANVSRPCFYALKASSFGEKRNFERVHKLVEHIRTGSTMPIDVLLDAEDSPYTSIEDEYHQKLRDRGHSVYKTYQMYRTDGMHRLTHDLENNLVDKIKLTRGAYLYSEKDKYLLHKSKDMVDLHYNVALEYVLQEMASKPNMYLMVATHNVKSVDKALNIIAKNRNIAPRVYFSQLLGMGDRLTMETRELGYQTCKYVPYGSLIKSLPYLMRRLVENADVLKHALC